MIRLTLPPDPNQCANAEDVEMEVDGLAEDDIVLVSFIYFLLYFYDFFTSPIGPLDVAYQAERLTKQDNNVTGV